VGSLVELTRGVLLPDDTTFPPLGWRGGGKNMRPVMSLGEGRKAPVMMAMAPLRWMLVSCLTTFDPEPLGPG
jgi:hypothetical protein